MKDSDNSELVEGKLTSKIPYHVTAGDQEDYVFAYTVRDAVKRSKFQDRTDLEIDVTECDPELVKKYLKESPKLYKKVSINIRTESFFRFKKRCRVEGIDDINQAIEKLITLYGDGAKFTL